MMTTLPGVRNRDRDDDRKEPWAVVPLTDPRSPRSTENVVSGDWLGRRSGSVTVRTTCQLPPLSDGSHGWVAQSHLTLVAALDTKA